MTTVPVDPATYQPTETGAINGGLPVLTIGVDDLDAALKRLADAGGKQVGESFQVPDLGRGAYFEDPEGNVLGLWQSLAR